MKSLAALKEMAFVPHHDCACCGQMVGWYVDGPTPFFDPSCDCGCSQGHYDTWEDVFKWYNSVFEKESSQAVNEEWERLKQESKKSVGGKMTRQNYINDINKELNEIEGKKNYWFHKMSEEQIYDKMKIKLWSGCRCLFDDIGILTAKDDFAKLAAMCMIAMELADTKLNAIESKEK